MHPQYPEVIKLRKKGQSYREIARAVGVSKNSVSRWCQNLELPPKAKRIIEEKIKYNKHFFESYNKYKHEVVQAENKKIKQSFSKKIKPISDYELLLIGTALYWGEGCKRHRRNYGEYASLCNSDPDIIKVFLRFAREVLSIPEERIKPSIRIHPNITRESAIDFWSKITNIPKDKFYITTQISRASQGKRPIYSLPYGTLEIRIPNRQRFFEILGLIDGLIKNT